MGMEEGNAPILETEKKAIFDIVKVKDQEKASVYVLEDLCDYVEKEIFQENEELEFEEQYEEEYDLGEVDFCLKINFRLILVLSQMEKKMLKRAD